MLAFLATSFSSSVGHHTMLANAVSFGLTSAVWIGEVLAANPEKVQLQSGSQVKLTECGERNRRQPGGTHATRLSQSLKTCSTVSTVDLLCQVQVKPGCFTSKLFPSPRVRYGLMFQAD